MLARLALICLSVIIACGSPVDSEPMDDWEFEREVGYLRLSDLVGPVEILIEGPTLRIQVVTLGLGCARKGDTRMERTGDELRITPFDLHPPPGAPCPRVVQRFEHEVTADREGVRYVIVEGRTFPTLEAVRLEYGIGAEPR